MGRLADKVAIVTGAAQGMGEATARLFVEQGARKDACRDILAGRLRPERDFRYGRQDRSNLR